MLNFIDISFHPRICIAIHKYEKEKGFLNLINLYVLPDVLSFSL